MASVSTPNKGIIEATRLAYRRLYGVDPPQRSNGQARIQDQFIADNGTRVAAWIEDDLLVVCTGDGEVKLERNSEVEKFIEFILKVNAEVWPEKKDND